MRARMNSHRLRPALLLVLVVGFVVALQVTPAFAATITVDTNADELNSDGDCSLREAVAAANTDGAVDNCTAGSGADDIVFSANYTITLGGSPAGLGQLYVTAPLTITGPTTVQSSTATGAARTRLFLVGSSLTLSGMTLPTGSPNAGYAPSSNIDGASSTSSNGGCIYVRPSATLTLDNTTLGISPLGASNGCRASNGGGIYADEDSTVNVNNGSTIQNARASTNGGGINMSTGFITIDGDSSIVGNSATAVGGGIYVGDTVTLVVGGGSASNRAFITGNNANGAGGGIYMDVNSTFVGDHARFFSNTSFGSGSAWFSQGGSSSSNDTGNQGRSCIDCCIVNNNGTYAVYQEFNDLDANWNNNWWGTDWGPRIYDQEPAQTDTSFGVAFSNGDGIFGFWPDPQVDHAPPTQTTSPVAVTVTDDGGPAAGPDAPQGSWYTLATISGGPSDCSDDVCTEASSVFVTRVCTAIP